MTSAWQQCVESIHGSPHQGVVAITGGGISALSELFGVPGASRTMLEAVVPYAEAALGEWLGKRIEHACDEETALALASVAYRRARKLAQANSGTPPPLLGIGCTAALVSDRPKRGPHRAFVAAQTSTATISAVVTLDKGIRNRPEEDALVGHLLLQALASACDLPNFPPLDLKPADVCRWERSSPDPLLAAVWSGDGHVVWSIPAGTLHSQLPQPPAGILCGSFNPLHPGHEALQQAAEARLGGAVAYELSITNVEKPPLDFLTIARRRAQFSRQPLALTNAPTFAEKAAIFPDTTFVVGLDTAERILDPRFCTGEFKTLDAVIGAFRAARCRFLVAGRATGERYLTLEDIRIPPEYADLFKSLPEREFRLDISSTDLRRSDKTDDQ